MIFIKLHTPSNPSEEFYFNSKRIVSIFEAEHSGVKCSKISISNRFDDYYLCLETPEQILKLIREEEKMISTQKV